MVNSVKNNLENPISLPEVKKNQSLTDRVGTAAKAAFQKVQSVMENKKVQAVIIIMGSVLTVIVSAVVAIAIAKMKSASNHIEIEDKKPGKPVEIEPIHIEEKTKSKPPSNFIEELEQRFKIKRSEMKPIETDRERLTHPTKKRPKPPGRHKRRNVRRNKTSI